MKASDPRRKKLAELILKKREQELKMSQQEFCEYVERQTGIEVSYGAVQGWEKANGSGTLPKTDNFWAIARITGMTMDELYNYLKGEIKAEEVKMPDFNLDLENLKQKIAVLPPATKIEILNFLQADLFSKLPA
ncbi:helix-turn-helix domain-containing protein [Gloeothece verrucosa]|uniref:Helix-turn-helix domain protein n=1 Tax=Gloeothece verrucosa (strain PCC 7822) TaxID=497965 RepID=E0UAI2_GLOV7|nr:helix-turn-helix domain-containing protein [Gloeothece verrucosa]ADN12723.1 helix-turn-helix domain protein [Gloeothece verrucosa PCC 7822]